MTNETTDPDKWLWRIRDASKLITFAAAACEVASVAWGTVEVMEGHYRLMNWALVSLLTSFMVGATSIGAVILTGSALHRRHTERSHCPDCSPL